MASPITPALEALTKAAADALVLEQETYFQANGTYRPSSVLKGGEKPLDRDVETMSYDSGGENGKGFIVIRRVSLAGKRYQKVENHGPESWRERDWLEVAPEMSW